MGIGDTYGNVLRSWPVRAAIGLAARTGRPVWHRVIGASLNEAELQKRAAETPLAKAELGVTAVRQGIETRDPELRDLGQAIVAAAIADAAEQSHDLVVHAAVTEVASLVPLQNVAENPFVSPPMAHTVADFLAEAPKRL